MLSGGPCKTAWHISQGVHPPSLPPSHPPTHTHALTHTQPDEIGFMMLVRLCCHETTNTSYMSTAEYNPKKTDSRRGVGKGEGYGWKLARVNSFYQTFRKKYSTSSEQQCRKRVGQSQTALTDDWQARRVDNGNKDSLAPHMYIVYSPSDQCIGLATACRSITLITKVRVFLPQRQD